MLTNGAVLGLETDILWKKQDRKHDFDYGVEHDATWAFMHSKPAESMTPKTIKEFRSSFKEKWTGATRVRLGFAKGKILPYIAGGITYSNIFTNARLLNGPIKNTTNFLLITNKATTMIGWTAGAGVDCALTNNLLLRLEYRYSNFGKKDLKYTGDKQQLFLYEFKHNIHDVRVGLSYKFY